MTFLHFTRRLHLYLGMVLMPWFFMYGLSSVPFAHGEWVRRTFYPDGSPDWSVRLERPYSIEIPEGAGLRAVGAQMLQDSNTPPGSFGVYRQDGRVQVYRYDFLHASRVTYDPQQKKLLAEDKRFRWDQFLTGMHARGGFNQSGVLNHLWGIMVDLVCLGMLLWIASGLVMWWRIPGHRVAGWVALLGGVASFGLFLWKL